jgi:hypothetical protein
MRVALTVLYQFIAALMGVNFRQAQQLLWLTIVNVTGWTKRNFYPAGLLFRKPWQSRRAAEIRVTVGRNSGSLNTAIMKATDTITVIEGYDAMRVFLETVWRRHGKPVEEIAFVLGGLKWADGSPVDPTMWQDWLAAAQIAASAGCSKIAEGR